MEHYVLEIFADYGEFALWISIAISILVSIAGILPSVFVTAANITFFGFTEGLYISLAGESLGAIVSFGIYRKGIKKMNIASKNKLILRLQSAQGLEAFLLIVALRLFPFAPSGLVTLAGAGSSIGLVSYSIASTIGKIPALLIEAYTVLQVIHLGPKVQLILGLIAIGILTALYLKKKKYK